MKNDGLTRLLEEVLSGSLISATISSLKDKSSTFPIKLGFRSIKIKQNIVLQISEHFKQKVLHKNVSFAEAVKLINEAMLIYKQGVFKTTNCEFHLLVDKDDQIKVIVRETNEKLLPVLDHNTSKKYLLQEGQAIPFLVHLGIMSKDGKVIAKKYDKFRQINRFLEMVKDVLPSFSKDRPLRIIDFGCGKAYLTFALHYFLHDIHGFELDMTGLDLKADVVKFCNDVAEKLSLKGLNFLAADINTYETNGAIDLMISLHACDTATDAALAKSISWKTKVILCVPCCQHELFKQVRSDILKPLLKYGLLKERFSALATDAMRAENLALQGYDVDILEFIDMEHTPKNLAIRACKKENKLDPSIQKERAKVYLEFKQFLSADLALDRLLGLNMN